MRNNLLYLSILLLFFTNCKSGEKMLAEGDYDRVIDKYIDKVNKGLDNNVKQVKWLEEAYENALRQDNRNIDRLLAGSRLDKYQEIFAIAKRKRKRKDKIEPKTPLLGKNGYQSYFNFEGIETAFFEAQKLAAKESYDLGVKQLELARNTMVKQDYIEAAKRFDRVGDYIEGYKNTAALLNEALEKGTYQLGVSVQNNTERTFVSDLKIHLINTYQTPAIDPFIRLGDADYNPSSFDYVCKLDVNFFDLSPEQVQERFFTESKEIEVGEQELVDENGKVIRDTAGVALTQMTYEVIYADVTEVRQFKEAFLKANILFLDASGKLVDKVPVSLNAMFENYASTFEGNRKALSKETLLNIGGAPVSFPTDREMFNLLLPDLEAAFVSQSRNLMRH